MVKFEGTEVSAGIKSFLLPYFADCKIISIKDNHKVVDHLLNRANENTFYIYESAVPKSLEGAKFETEPGTMQWEGEQLFADPESLSPNSVLGGVPKSHVKTWVYSDDGKFISFQKYNTLIFAGKMEDFSEGILQKLLSYYGYVPLSQTEIFMSGITKFVMSGKKNQLKVKRDELKRQEDQMKQSYKQYMDYMKRYDGIHLTVSKMEEALIDTEKELSIELERLFRSRHLESAEFQDGDRMVLITKPLTMGIWDIGTWRIEYTLGSDLPRMSRITPPQPEKSLMVLVPGSRSIFDIRKHTHPHNNDNGTHWCYGNATELLKTFWKGRFETGFNLVIQYLRTYNGEGPYQKLPSFLKSLGYINDSEKLKEHGDHGLKYILAGTTMQDQSGRDITEEILREEWGCTGELDISPKNYLKDMMKIMTEEQRETLSGIEVVDESG